MHAGGGTYEFHVAHLGPLRAALLEGPDAIDRVLATSGAPDVEPYLRAYAPAGGLTREARRHALGDVLDAAEAIVEALNSNADLVRLAAEAADGHPADHRELADAFARSFAGAGGSEAGRRLHRHVLEDLTHLLCRPEPNGDRPLVGCAAVPRARDVDVAFSGGGMRAAAFALGAQLYLRDAGQLHRVRQVSSVSGGSITNGFLATVATDHDDLLDADAGRLARRLAHQGYGLERFGRQLAAIVALCAAALVVALVVVLVVAVTGVSRLWLLLALAASAGAVALAWAGLHSFEAASRTMASAWFDATTAADDQPPFRLGRRHLVSRRLLAAALARRGSRALLLRDVRSPVTHVFSATDLRHGQHVHVSQHWLTSDTYGVTDPGDLRTGEAVAASAAFPGALPPVRVAIGRVHLPPHLTVGETHLELVDGGVRDNLGHVFDTRLVGAAGTAEATLTRYGSTHFWVVVDASAPRGVADLGEGALDRIPVLRRFGQLRTFPRVIGILNQSNSQARALALDAALGADGSGFVVSVQDSPVDRCRAALDDPAEARRILTGGHPTMADGDRRGRAARALRTLVRDDPAAEAHWNGEGNQNRSTPTTLSGLGEVRVRSLVRHGYVLAMCVAHIEHDWPLLPGRLWSRERFAALLDGGPGSGDGPTPAPASEAVVDLREARPEPARAAAVSSDLPAPQPLTT